ncbi:MAG: VCBS repeat-containing protein [Bacteroidota bacterium]
MKRLTLVCLLYLGFPNSIFSQFSPQKVISEQSAFYARHIAPADIDQDGDMDVFAFNDGEPDFLSWHENDGEGNFINRTIIGDGLDNTYRIKVLDINDDAAPDLITIRTTEDFSIEEIRLFQNDGNGNFTDQVIFSGRVLIMSVDFVDLNNDRILDLLMVQDFDRYELAYYPNDQNYPLEQSVQLKELTNDDDLRFTLADFDMDGRMDVMEINHKKSLIQSTLVGGPTWGLRGWASHNLC